jgi:predicted RNA-binding protein
MSKGIVIVLYNGYKKSHEIFPIKLIRSYIMNIKVRDYLEIVLDEVIQLVRVVSFIAL